MEAERKKILLSPNPELLASVRESLLKTSRTFPLVANTTEEIFFLAQNWKPHIIILDPEEASAVCRKIKSTPEIKRTPVLAVVGNKDLACRDRVLEAGCDDFLETPLEESTVLDKVEELIGLRFRRIPRFVCNTISTVVLKNREIPCNTINVSRIMIFLQCQEDLAPAVGKNVRVNFQMSKNEDYLSCWTRVERLLVRKFPREEKKSIGILLRFLDLPEAISQSIDERARQQIQMDLDRQAAKSAKPLIWQECDEYEALLSKFIQEEASNHPHEALLPNPVIEAFSSGLSDIERASFNAPGNTLTRHMAGMRLKLLDDLHKLREGGRDEDFERVISTAEDAELVLKNKIHEMIMQKNEAESIIYWSKVKYDIIRTRLDMNALIRLRSPFSRALDHAASGSGLWSRIKGLLSGPARPNL